MVKSPVGPPSADIETDKGNHYSGCEFNDIQECDLAAQQSMAESTNWMNRAAWVGIALTVLGLILLWRTMRYTRDAARYTRDAVDEGKKTTAAAIAANDLHERVARQAERAWLKITPELRSHIQFNEAGDASLRIKFVVENIGKSPAFAVDVHAEVYLCAPDWDRPEIAQLNFANTIRGIHQNDSGAIVFPGDDWKRTPDLKIWSNDAKKARKQTEVVDGRDDGYLFPFIIGCVQYLTRPDDRNPSQTGFIYAIRVRREGDSPGWVPDGVSIDRKDVVLEVRSLDPHAVT